MRPDRTRPSGGSSVQDLSQRYSRFLAEHRKKSACQPASVDRHRRTVADLKRRGITRVGDLAARFIDLPKGRKASAIDLITSLEIRQAIPVLLASLDDRDVRISCADAVARLGGGAKGTQLFLKIGRRELASSQPDAAWLRAAILGLGLTHTPPVSEILLSIFERTDLPGELRGEAGDKLGCHGSFVDRRTGFYRRFRDAVLRGLDDNSIDVQFWSMYLIASLCNVAGSRRSVDKAFRGALPRLKDIASNDHRLAPGFWWSMSAEAEDAIGCIQTGRWPEPDAADRWQRRLPAAQRRAPLFVPAMDLP